MCRQSRALSVRLVFPHQLFEAHMTAPAGTVFVVVEDDLYFRQYRFHAHKLVLHRASMRRFVAELTHRGYEVTYLQSRPERSSNERLIEVLRSMAPQRVEVMDVVDDWLSRKVTAAVQAAGCGAQALVVLESVGFLTSRDQLRQWFMVNQPRMRSFYMWQRRRLGVLVDGTRPVGGRWSFDTENRKRLPRGHFPPAVRLPGSPDALTQAAIREIAAEFPDAPGDPATFGWPTSREQARAHVQDFVAQRLALFGPYEDAISRHHRHLYHAVLTPMLNIGLVTPAEVLDDVLAVAERTAVPIASLEGFVRQLVGWREYVRGMYEVAGPRLRTSNELGHHRALDASWWTARTGLAPVDVVLGRVLESGYAHHIERLMILGGVMCLLRVDPTEVYEWFMAMFIDAYDWVMVPNVYGMSQFAAGTLMTTKPYVSSSSYVRSMSDMPAGGWHQEWDSLYWAFVHDHREVFERNGRSRMIPRIWDGFDTSTRIAHLQRASAWLT